MKTEYQILWIEDDFGALSRDQIRIESFLRQSGIEAIFDICLLSTDLTEEETQKKLVEIQQKSRSLDLDLIFMDYNIRTHNGAAFILEFREEQNFLPIVFYSSDESGMRQAAAEAEIDGVYFSHRNNLADTAIQVISSLLRKEETIKNTRGLLMDGASEIEASFEDITDQLWPSLTDKDKNDIITDLTNKLSERSKSIEKIITENPMPPTELNVRFNHLYKNRSCDAMIKWKIIKKLLELQNLEEKKRVIFDRLYQADKSGLLNIRNMYAHQTLKQLDPQHNKENCIKIRNELREQIINTRSLQKIGS